MSELLSKIHYDAFANSSQFMAIYDWGKHVFVELNPSMKTRMGTAKIETIYIICSAEHETYLTLSGIPCRLRKIVELQTGLCVVEMFPAHTKSWNQSSDLVHLTDLTSDGVSLPST
jgi:hypothetical protein